VSVVPPDPEFVVPEPSPGYGVKPENVWVWAEDGVAKTVGSALREALPDAPSVVPEYECWCSGVVWV